MAIPWLPLAVTGTGLLTSALAPTRRVRRPGPFIPSEQLPGQVQRASSLIGDILGQDLATSPLFGPIQELQFGPEERARAVSLFGERQAPTLRETLGGIQAATQRAGLGGTTVPAQLEQRARERAGVERLAFETQLDELARNLAAQRFQMLLGGGQFVAGIAAPALRPMADTTPIERSPTLAGQVGPALTGLGGQLLGLFALGASPSGGGGGGGVDLSALGASLIGGGVGGGGGG